MGSVCLVASSDFSCTDGTGGEEIPEKVYVVKSTAAYGGRLPRVWLLRHDFDGNVISYHRQHE